MISSEDLRRAAAGLDDRFGAARARAFGEALPGVVSELTERWQLEVEGRYASGATSVVLGATTAGRGPAVLKVSPDAAFLRSQVQMLRHLAPTGRVPRVLADDPAMGAVLLERVLPGHTLDRTRSSPPSAQEWALLLGDLHGTAAAGVDGTLAARCEEMIDRIGARQQLPSVRAEVPDTLWQRAVADCRELLRQGPDPVVIHGDLHLGNVLDGGSRGLVAIDPKLCLGDPCFDMVDFVIADGDPAAMRARADELAVLVGIDPDHLHRWTRVNAVVTAISSITWDGPTGRSTALLELAAGG
ncbi:aminoglycoside phosphotransferase family protein [Serinicoccus kebangsaanensis]|uniref:aminoglycoside phosphotransferase family protein n=1 Tax=Serinicoccus kebangsaanensis TaxID=2602069 RepID=UPI00178C17C1|nr:phosphotransferase [Serinicoccus kebangsaanensis]